MRKIGFTKYKKTTKEILPKTYKVNEITCQRRMFCTMINQYLSSQSRLNLNNNHIYKNSLLHIFEDKIMSFFQFYKFRIEKPEKIVKIYKHDSILFNQYFKQSTNTKMRFMSSKVHFKQDFRMLLGYTHPVTDLIQLIFNGKEVEMMLDLNEIFRRTIYSRIKQEINKTVTMDAPFIHIDQGGIRTRLYPKWKHIDPSNLEQRREDIKDGFKDIKDKEVDNYYLVYPKMESFTKHITLEDEVSDKVKIIPYSFSYINRKEKRCKK